MLRFKRIGRNTGKVLKEDILQNFKTIGKDDMKAHNVELSNFFQNKTINTDHHLMMECCVNHYHVL